MYQTTHHLVAHIARTAAAAQPRTAQIAQRTRGFSLLETTIAVGILGIGLILVAAIFPVALTQHRESTHAARSIETFAQARAMISAKIDTDQLWVDAAYLPGGILMTRDSPWYLLPTANLRVGNDCWDAMLQGTAGNESLYANRINGAPSNQGNLLALFGLDILSDKLAPFTLWTNGDICSATGNGILPTSASPFTDAEFTAVPNRQVWYGFYRRLATGSFEFAVAACKQRKGQTFAEQDVTVPGFTANLVAASTDRRLPVPWRVLVGWPRGNVLTNAPVVTPAPPSGIGLARLAPIGTKLMVRGGVDVVPATPTPPQIRSGVILTVSDIIDDYTVEFVGDTSGLLLYDPDGLPGPPTLAFDVWVFPPSIDTGGLGASSPLLDWRVPL